MRAALIEVKKVGLTDLKTCLFNSSQQPIPCFGEVFRAALFYGNVMWATAVGWVSDFKFSNSHVKSEKNYMLLISVIYLINLIY